MDGKLYFLAMVAGILILAWLGAFVLWHAAEMSEIVAPIDPQEFEELSVVTVGTGTGYENPNRHGPSTAIGLGRTIVLVDAGRGIAEGLRSARIPLNQPALIVLTNLLPLNTLGLDDLLMTGWLVPREEPLRIIGPIGTRNLVESLEKAHAAGRDALGRSIALPTPGGRFEVTEVSDGYEEEIERLKIEARALPGGPLPTLAWRFSDGSHRIVVSGSGWGHEVLASFAGGADVLVHEAAYIPSVAELEGTGAEVPNPERLELEAKFHTSILEVGSIATEAQIDRLVLVRLRPPPFFDLQVRSLVANDYSGEIVVANDGDTVFP
jgi:ribonuclease BN (tRNA processing enzyme)